VTHLPEIHHVDLVSVFQALHTHTTSSNTNSTSTGSNISIVEKITDSSVCIVVATDGVWDNWLYEDVGRFMLDGSCLSATAAGSDGAQKVVSSFMIRNAQFSKKNFGNQADNATGIALYLSHAPSFST
jgi:hypothetical protein